MREVRGARYSHIGAKEVKIIWHRLVNEVNNNMGYDASKLWGIGTRLANEMSEGYCYETGN